MRPVKNIPTLKDDGFKMIMSYYDPVEYNKKNINDFYIHGLSDDTYELKMPLPPHRQANHSIILVTQGSILAGSGLDNYVVEKNSMIVISAGQITSLSFMSDDIEGYYLHFSDDYLSQANNDFSDWFIRPIIKFQNEVLPHLLSLLRRMQTLNENENNVNIIKAYILTFLTEVNQSVEFESRTNFSASERLTTKFKKLLEKNVTKEKSVVFYANELNVTANHLNKSVKIALDKTASTLINDLLILEVKVLLKEKQYSVSDIAFECGFDDLSYFGRFFKKHTGLSPIQYRNVIDLSE